MQSRVLYKQANDAMKAREVTEARRLRTAAWRVAVKHREDMRLRITRTAIRKGKAIYKESGLKQIDSITIPGSEHSVSGCESPATSLRSVGIAAGSQHKEISAA